MSKETQGVGKIFSTQIKENIDAFAKNHPEIVRNAIRLGGALTLVGTAVGLGAVENKSTHEVLADNTRPPICHSGNGKNWTIIRPDENSYDAHLKDWQGKAKGHDNDYFAYDKDGDGDIDKDDCGFVPPTETAVFTPVPSLTPEMTATFMPSPTVIFTPTETQPTAENSPTSTPKETATEIAPTPVKSSTPTEKLVCPPGEDCYCEKVLAGTVAAAIHDAANQQSTAEIEAAQMLIDNENKNATADAKSASTPNQTPTPQNLQNNEVVENDNHIKSSQDSDNKKSVDPLKCAEAVAVGTILIGLGAAGAVGVDKINKSRKKK